MIAASQTTCRRLGVVFIVGVLSAWSAPGFCRAPIAAPLRVEDALNTARFLPDVRGDANLTNINTPPVSISPDGRHFLVRIIRGDVHRNGVWLEIYMGNIGGSSEPLLCHLVAKLFTSAYERPPHTDLLLEERYNPITWINSSEIAFRWRDSRETAQIVRLDLNSGHVAFVTHNPLGVSFFSAGPDQHFLSASYLPQHPISRVQHDQYGGTIVDAVDAFALLDGRPDGRGVLASMYDRQLALISDKHGTVRQLTTQLKSVSYAWLAMLPAWSTSGRHVAFGATPARIPTTWRKYLSLPLAPSFKRALQDAFLDPTGWYGRDILQPYVLATDGSRIRPLWSAPIYTDFDHPFFAVWSPDETMLLLGPTVCPIGSQNSQCNSGPVLAVVNVRTGRFSLLPIPPKTLSSLLGIEWEPSGDIKVHLGDKYAVYSKSAAGWHELGSGHWMQSAKRKFVVRQDLNHPPSLYAEYAGASNLQPVLDPNPELLSRFHFAHVDHLLWKTSWGERRFGLLYYPIDYKPGRAYPLVVQLVSPTLADHLDEFDIYGAGVGKGLGPSPSIYIAQLLAAHDIAVLVTSRLPASLHQSEEAETFESITSGISATRRHISIDMHRVGISGHSRNGWLVKQAISHCDFEFAAAIVSDSFDSGYVAQTLVPEDDLDAENGSAPFGRGLANWLEHSAGFNADRIRTPLLLEDESEPGSGTLGSWELFSRLRALHLPVEYYLIPFLDRGSHILQNPEQLIAVKSRALDWFDFWLNGHEDADPKKRGQYLRWQSLRLARDKAQKIPRPPILVWDARPAVTNSRH